MLESVRGDGLVAILRGDIASASRGWILESGDIETLEALKKAEDPITQEEVELLFITKT